MATGTHTWHQRNGVALLVMALIFSIYFIIILFSEGSHGGADSFVHYRISRFAFRYPYLFFDHWGKPLFVMLSAPFAQLGFTGIRVFNILCGMASGWFAFQLAKRLSLPYPLLALLLVVLAPFFAAILMSGLTEPLFGLVLILSVYLFFTEKPIAAACVISLIPFCRTEGVIFLPLFALAFLVCKHYKALPFLAVGSVGMGIAGAWAHDGDLFWIITRAPYQTTEAFYGTGSFWHFFGYSELIFGLPLQILFALGVLSLSGLWLSAWRDKHRFVQWLLLAATSAGYFLAHSTVWWLGVGASAGLIRVITGIIPVAGVVALYPLSLAPIARNSVLQGVVAGTFAVWAFIVPFSTDKFPVELGAEEKVLMQAVHYLEAEELDETYLVYYNPILSIFMDKDPYDLTRSKEGVWDPANPSHDLPEGAIIAWDAHFGPNEGGLPLENLNTDPNLVRLEAFYPEESFEVMGGYTYHVVLFQKQTGKPGS